MASAAAHRAALRRAREPTVLLPDQLSHFPSLPEGYQWRNPVTGCLYVRDRWELYGSFVSESPKVAEVRELPGARWGVWFPSSVAVGAREPDFIGSILEAFEHVTARCW